MNRYELISQLLGEEDRFNSEYISGQIDRDTWTKNLQSIDERLAVLGLRLAYRPWEPTSHVPPF
jgi:hypothetical protein